jgi:hypothetical protein
VTRGVREYLHVGVGAANRVDFLHRDGVVLFAEMALRGATRML